MDILHLFDLDGTCIKAGRLAYDSMQWKVDDALSFFGISKLTKEEWNSILKSTTGTTEKNFITTVANVKGIKSPDLDEFIRTYYFLRETYLSLINREFDSKFLSLDDFDRVYYDAQYYLEYLNANPGNKIRVVTGNPRKSAYHRLRLNPELLKYFRDRNGLIRGAFGDEAMSRKEIIELAIFREQINGFQVKYDKYGFAQNVVYYGDASHDLYAGILAKVKTVFIPRIDYDPTKEFTFDLLKQYLYRPESILSEEDIRVALMGNETMFTSTLLNPGILRFTNPELELKEVDNYLKLDSISGISNV